MDLNMATANPLLSLVNVTIVLLAISAVLYVLYSAMLSVLLNIVEFIDKRL